VIPLKNTFSLSSVDTQGNIFIADNKGNIFKYDSLGKEISVYSPIKKSKVALLNAELSMKIWVFYEDIQQLIVLDRLLKPIETISFETSDAFISLVASDYDNHIWWIDNTDFSLKKQSLINKQIVNTTRLNLILTDEAYHFDYMRYYQNRLYVSYSGKGILVFDNLGNLIKEWPLEGIEKFSFHQNEIFYCANNQVVFMDIESGEIRQEEVSKNLIWIEMVGKLRYEVYSDHLEVYKK